jgi:hypothetical protein
MFGRTLAAVAGVLLVASATAHADPLTDFSIGTNVYVRNGSATVAGYTHSVSGIALTKPTNTLSFSVNANAIGVPLPITLALTGTDMGNGNVTFTFDQSYAGVGLPLVDGLHLTRATGTIYAVASYIPGNTGPFCNGAACLGDVYLDIVSPLSTIHATGDFGDQYISIDYAQVIGGVQPPHLQSFYYPGGAPICSQPTATTVPLTVRLASPAPSTGTQVLLHSAYANGVTLPVLQEVASGKDSTTVAATIQPNFYGTVHLAAAAGGAESFLDIDVLHQHDCDPASSKKQWADYYPNGCIECTGFTAHNNEGDEIYLSGRVQQLVMGDGRVIDPKTFAPSASAVTVNAIANNGMAAGVMSFTSGTTTMSWAYRINVNDTTGSLWALGQFTPKAINQFGTVVGTAVVSGAQVAVYDNGHGTTQIPIRGAVSSSASIVTDRGEVLGTYLDSANAVHGFRYAGGTFATVLPTFTIPGAASAPILPVAENELGTVLGTAAIGTGTVSVVISPSGTVTQIAPPSGYTNFVARGINRAGRVVGHATTSTGVLRGLVWNPTSGFIAMTGYILGLTATDAYHINDSDEVVVSGTLGRNLTTTLYVISL